MKEIKINKIKMPDVRPYVTTGHPVSNGIIPENQYFIIYQTRTPIRYIDGYSQVLTKYGARLRDEIAEEYDIPNKEDYRFESDNYEEVIDYVNFRINEITSEEENEDETFQDDVQEKYHISNIYSLMKPFLDTLSGKDVQDILDECSCGEKECCSNCPDLTENEKQFFQTEYSDELKVGDVVQLKSGSPYMTISDITVDFIDAIHYEHGDIRRHKLSKEVLNKIVQ